MAGDDGYEIPETGAVFTFGRSRFAENLSSHFFIRNDSVLEISCGDEHTALICKSGRVFLFGNNDYGQLGFGHTKVVSKPSCLKYLKTFHSIHVACGKSHTIVSTTCNRLFGFGCNSDGQLGTGDLTDRLIPQIISTELAEGENIIAVSAGCYHSAFLTSNGQLYMWGNNSDGQCGAEEPTNFCLPNKVDFENQISSISCGYYHTAFISSGNVYTFGEEDNGKLGQSSKTSKKLPGKVDISESCIAVECGGNHTLVLTENGKAYAFGSNFSGQLGLGNCEPEVLTPTQINFPEEGEQIVKISCGESHTAFVTENGTLYTCGDARHGKLCNEIETTNLNVPTFINVFQNYFCLSVTCGGCHTMVLAKIRDFVNGGEDNPKLQSKNETLPPLKPLRQTIPIYSQVKDEKVENTNSVQKSSDEIEECDSKSNTESNLNEEAISHSDEIYTEIGEIQNENSNEIVISKENFESKDIHEIKNESVEDDYIVTPKEKSLKKLINIFKRHKIPSSKFNKGKNFQLTETTNGRNTEGNQASRACNIL